jgi:hypothetical protein
MLRTIRGSFAREGWGGAALVLPLVAETRLANASWIRDHVRRNMPVYYQQCVEVRESFTNMSVSEPEPPPPPEPPIIAAPAVKIDEPSPEKPQIEIAYGTPSTDMSVDAPNPPSIPEPSVMAISPAKIDEPAAAKPQIELDYASRLHRTV